MLCFGVQAIMFISYSSPCMVYEVVWYLFIDIFNANNSNIRPLYICYHQLVVCFQCYSVYNLAVCSDMQGMNIAYM